MLNAAEHSSGRSVEDVYGAMLHKDAMYILKFDGNYEEISMRFTKKSLSENELTKLYNKYFERYNSPEKAFIKFVEEVIFKKGSVSFDDDGFHLYEVKTNNKGSLIKSTEKYANKKSSVCK